MDRERVVKGLEYCKEHDGANCPECPYFDAMCVDDLSADALELLKEQDALCFALEQANNTNKYLNDVLAKKGVEPKKIVGLIDCSSPWLQYSCGNCKEPLLIRYKFCPNCGKPIRWR